jgi:predicted RND superfamily exporter protein
MDQTVLPKSGDGMEVHATLDTFDVSSGSKFERMLFNNRIVFLLLCAVLTVFLGFQALKVRINADYNDTIPLHQAFIVNYLHHFEELQSQANAVQISVTTDNGNIIDPHYLNVLQKISDQVYLLPGVNRPFMTSLWTSNTRWVAVTADGLDSGPVISNSYDGSPEQLQVVAGNIKKTSLIGKLISSNWKSSMIYVPLLEKNNMTRQPLNYGQLARELNGIRAEYKSQGVTLRIIGFAMVVGDMINGINEILTFFGISILIAAAFLLWYTRCVRSTILVVVASLVAVTWQMGILSYFGFGLTPYSVLVPFLVFAIGTSHGAQKMNGVMQDIGRGTHPLVSARYTFRRLFLAGFAALVCDVMSFAVLLTIPIEAIRQLATIASIGVGILVITNLMMLPTMLSFTGVSKNAAARSLENTPSAARPRQSHPLWNFLDLFTKKKYATIAVAFMIIIGSFGWVVGRHVQVGDLDSGAPELRPNSQYNQDNAFIVKNFTTGNDTFIVMDDTPAQGCMNYDNVTVLNNLQWKLQQLPVVQSTSSVGAYALQASMLLTEAAPKWFGIEPNQPLLNLIFAEMPPGLANFSCTFTPLYIYLKDHKARTLDTIVTTMQQAVKNPDNQSPNFKLSLAGGNAGIAAATNIVIKRANAMMLVLVYTVVIVFCLITFRSWRAVICAVLPLVVTTLLSQALMVWLGIGVKVATLPVIALGVGIGVDYALYVLSIMLKHLRSGASLSDAYHHTLLFTGRVVILTGITLATGVITWIFAPIKFQADMGLLLSFMFLWNMCGAMIFLPALAYFLLPPKLFKKAV